ncbi:hypothetical protein [Streptosporangium subroseum]|nr:hypothetical protein OHB15_15620 [Streptosporangium subroseum]
MTGTAARYGPPPRWFNGGWRAVSFDYARSHHYDRNHRDRDHDRRDRH